MDKNRVITVQNIPITISRADIDDYMYNGYGSSQI